MRKYTICIRKYSNHKEHEQTIFSVYATDAMEALRIHAQTDTNLTDYKVYSYHLAQTPFKQGAVQGYYSKKGFVYALSEQAIRNKPIVLLAA